MQIAYLAQSRILYFLLFTLFFFSNPPSYGSDVDPNKKHKGSQSEYQEGEDTQTGTSIQSQQSDTVLLVNADGSKSLYRAILAKEDPSFATQKSEKEVWNKVLKIFEVSLTNFEQLENKAEQSRDKVIAEAIARDFLGWIRGFQDVESSDSESSKNDSANYLSQGLAYSGEKSKDGATGNDDIDEAIVEALLGSKIKDDQSASNLKTSFNINNSALANESQNHSSLTTAPTFHQWSNLTPMQNLELYQSVQKAMQSDSDQMNSLDEDWDNTVNFKFVEWEAILSSDLMDFGADVDSRARLSSNILKGNDEDVIEPLLRQPNLRILRHYLRNQASLITHWSSPDTLGLALSMALNRKLFVHDASIEELREIKGGSFTSQEQEPIYLQFMIGNHYNLYLKAPIVGNSSASSLGD